MSIQSLKISETPKAFLDLATKHNALVDLVSKIAGRGGITVVIGDDGILIDGSSVAGGGDLEQRVIDLEDYVQELETLTNGLSRTNVSYCSAGTTTTKTVLMS